MPGIVHAIAGKKIENAASILSEKFAPQALPVANVHVEKVEQPNPFRIDVFGVDFACRASAGASDHSGPLGNENYAERSSGIRLVN